MNAYSMWGLILKEKSVKSLDEKLIRIMTGSEVIKKKAFHASKCLLTQIKVVLPI